jgi:hypothetical protein
MDVADSWGLRGQLQSVRAAKAWTSFVRALTHHEEQGAISDLSREFGPSRSTVYEIKDTACEVLKAHFEVSDPAGDPVCVVVDRT